MNHDDDLGESLPPLPAFARSLLEAERRSPPPSSAQQRAVWRRTRQSLLAAGFAAPSLLAGKLSAAAFGSKLILVAAVAVVAGGVGTAVLVARRPSVRPAPSAISRAPAEPARPAALQPAPVVPAAAAAAAPAPAPTPAGDDSPAQERRLIDRARALVASGDEAAAFRVLAQHQRRFPQGLFAQEREAMQVLLLARAGRLDEARHRASGFFARYPGSVFAERIRRALAGAPAASP